MVNWFCPLALMFLFWTPPFAAVANVEERPSKESRARCADILEFKGSQNNFKRLMENGRMGGIDTSLAERIAKRDAARTRELMELFERELASFEALSSLGLQGRSHDHYLHLEGFQGLADWVQVEVRKLGLTNRVGRLSERLPRNLKLMAVAAAIKDFRRESEGDRSGEDVQAEIDDFVAARVRLFREPFSMRDFFRIYQELARPEAKIRVLDTAFRYNFNDRQRIELYILFSEQFSRLLLNEVEISSALKLHFSWITELAFTSDPRSNRLAGKKAPQFLLDTLGALGGTFTPDSIGLMWQSHFDSARALIGLSPLILEFYAWDPDLVEMIGRLTSSPNADLREVAGQLYSQLRD